MKPIILTDEIKAEYKKEFEAYIETLRTSEANITFSRAIKPIATDAVKPKVFFTPEAWIKTRSLIDHTSDEVQWHGLVRKEDNVYLIYDIILPPQTVSGTTSNTDQVKYNDWIMSQPDDIFNYIRMHGHSHVNMPVSPSGTDTTLYNNILQMLSKTDYYIFMIMNKRDDITIMLYDMAQNTMFDTKDIQLEILCADGVALADWHRDITAKYVSKPVVVSTYSAPTGAANQWSGVANKTTAVPNNYQGSAYSQENQQKVSTFKEDEEYYAKVKQDREEYYKSLYTTVEERFFATEPKRGVGRPRKENKWNAKSK